MTTLEELAKEAQRLVDTGVLTPNSLLDYMFALARDGNCGAQILAALRQL